MIRRAPHFLINPFFPMEITWPIVHRITPNLLHLIVIDISTKRWKQIFWFLSQGCTNGPPVLFWGLSVRIWRVRHPSVTSGDIGGMWMSATLFLLDYLYSWPWTSSVDSGFASTKGGVKIKVSSGFVMVKLNLNWPCRWRDYAYRCEQCQRAHQRNYHDANWPTHTWDGCPAEDPAPRVEAAGHRHEGSHLSRFSDLLATRRYTRVNST